MLFPGLPHLQLQLVKLQVKNVWGRGYTYVGNWCLWSNITADLGFIVHTVCYYCVMVARQQILKSFGGGCKLRMRVQHLGTVATLSQTQNIRVYGTVQNPTIRTRNGMKCTCMNEVMHKHSLGYIVIVLGKF